MHSVRRRQREIDVDKLKVIKDGMGLGWEDIELFLGVSQSQRKRYQACGRLPADRFYAFKDALLVRCEERARQEREHILSLFK